MGLDSYFKADWAHILASAGGPIPRAGWAPCGSAEDVEGQAQRLRAYRAPLMVVAQALGLADDRGPFLRTEGQRGSSRGPDRGAERSLPLDRGAGR